MSNLFSVTIFFVVFREALEVSFIVAVLLSLVEQVLHKDLNQTNNGRIAHGTTLLDLEFTAVSPRLVKKLKLLIIFGALVGEAIALAIGAAFIAIWYTQAKDLWSNVAEIWEGIVQLIASLIIFVMAVTMLRVEHARTKWRVKLENAFYGRRRDSGAKISKWVLFILPRVTVLRSGLEAVVFVGGVSLGLPATSIPIPTIIGVISGVLCGVILYQFSSRTTFKIFLICITNFILLMGAGLFSKAIWAFQENGFLDLVGASADQSLGTGPGSYDVRGNVWHLNCCDASTGSWSIFNSLFGWQNSATLGSVLSYVFYWLAVIIVLLYYKFRERTTIFTWESDNGKWRSRRREFGEEGSTANSSQAEKPVVSQVRA